MKNYHSQIKKQQGVVLVMALIMLLLVTIIGVSAVKNSTVDTQVAGNTIAKTLAFQGAESALGDSVSEADLSNIKDAADRDRTTPVTTTKTEDITSGAKLSSSGNVEFEQVLDGPVLNGFANSSDFKFQVFKITAETKIAATSVRDRHTEARAVQIPKQ